MKDSITPFDLENENNKEKEKKKVYVETNEHIRNRVKIFEDREKKNKSLKEELDYRQKVYEQNRAKTRERMRKLKQFLKEKKDNTKTNEEFFEINKEFFFQNGVKSYDELLKLIHNFDKENIEEIEREILEKYKKNLKIEKQSFEEGKEGFSILPNIENIKKNSFGENNIINEPKNYSFNENIKYNIRTELQILANKENKNILAKGENYSENGIPINELLDSKTKKILGRLSENDKINYQKVEQIIKDLNENKDKSYNDLIKKNFCVDCDKSFDNDNEEQCSLHKEHNIIQIDKGIIDDLDEELKIKINELDYNASLKKIYERIALLVVSCEILFSEIKTAWFLTPCDY